MTERVLLVSTQGSHLAQLLSLRSWWEGRERLWVCPDTADVRDSLEGERVVTSYSPTQRNLVNMVRNFFLALRVLRRERPSVLVSGGAGVAVPFFAAAWMMRIPTVFLEVGDEDHPAAPITGLLVGPFTTRRIVQWDRQLDSGSTADFVGPLV